jgi:hypothetical protein
VKHLKAVQKKFDQVAETRTYVIPLAVLLSAVPGYEELGQWFVQELTNLCIMRELEAQAG